jgi:hypothetical protein
MDPCPHHQVLEGKIDRILLAVEGDEAMGHRGIVKRLVEVENRTEWLYTKVGIAIGILTVAWAWILKVT